MCTNAEHLGVPALSNKDICRFDVAVDDARSVSGVESIGNVNGDGKKNFQFQRTPGDAVLQRQPVQKLHDDEGLPLVLPDLVDGTDVWMVQGGRSACLPAKAFQSLRVLGNVVRQELERYETTKLGVFRFVDNSHPTPAQLLDDAVVRDGLPYKLGRRSHWRKC